MWDLAKTRKEPIHEIKSALPAGYRLVGTAHPIQDTIEVRPGRESTRRLSPSYGEIEVGRASRFGVDLPGEGGFDLPSKELEEHASRIRLERPLGVERPAQCLFNYPKDALDIVDIADEGTVEVPIIDSPDDDLPLAFGQFAKGATEKAGAGGTAVEGKTATIHASISRAMGVQEAADSGLIPIQEADELATIEVRIDELEALLTFCLPRIPQDRVNRPWNEGEELGASSQTMGQLTSPRLPHVIETTTPGATLAVVRLTE